LMMTIEGPNNPRNVAAAPSQPKPAASPKPAGATPTTLPSVDPLPAPQGSLATAVARGVALFMGLFTLLNLAIHFRSRGFDANGWWINLNPLARKVPLAAQLALLFISLVWLAYAVMPDMARRRRRVTRI